ncbi:MAG: amidohydrolase [Gemmatimonadaceae bacterium]
MHPRSVMPTARERALRTLLGTSMLVALGVLVAPAALAQSQIGGPGALQAEIDRRTAAAEARVVAWRRDIHQHPELSNEETRTAALVAEHLRSLGMEVRTDVGGHGVVGILKGALPGPVVGLRADMDALPVTELVDLPFRSTVRTTYNGQETGVMHACGHDGHVAVLMGVAEVLTGMKERLPGTVKFIFQPAEESAPTGGAGPMIDAGVLDGPKVDAMFGLHIGTAPVGVIGYSTGASNASEDSFRIVVHGKQTHGAAPSMGIDPIVVGSQIVIGMQTIISRQSNLSRGAAVVTVGAFHGGLRENIIPDSAWMIGTVRTLDPEMRRDIRRRIEQTATNIARSAGATATVTIVEGYPVTVNDAALVNRMLPTLRRVAGAGNVVEQPPKLSAEDMSRFLERVPGFYFGLGATPRDREPGTIAANHSPLFYMDEAALPVGVRAIASLAVDYLTGAGTR